MTNVVDAEEPADAVHAQIEFLRPTEDRAYSYGYEPAAHEPRPTAVFEPHPVAIHNARTMPMRPSLDPHGASLIQHRSSVRDFYDEAQVVDVYYAEAAALIKLATGADRVLVFDHNIRCRDSIAARSNRYALGRPVLHAHTDFTEVSALRRLHDVLASEATTRLHHRFLQVNLWRPISGPLRDAPLAICDASSITHRQLAPVDLLYPERRGEIYYLTFDSAQRWFYAPEMQPDEAWLLKNYDSAAAGKACFAAHCAFNDPTPWPHVPPRQSIEIRAFALFAA
jgi:hypothetical protein